MFFPFSVKNQASHSYKTTDKIMVLYIKLYPILFSTPNRTYRGS